VGVMGTGGVDGVAMVWDTGHTAGDLGEHNMLTVMAHNGLPVNDIAFMAGNHLAVTASSDEAVRVWRVADGTLLQSMVTGEVTVNVLRCRAQGAGLGGHMNHSLIVAGTVTGSVFCWHVEHERPPARQRGGVRDTTRSTAAGAKSNGGDDDAYQTKQHSHKLVALSDHSAHSIIGVNLLDNGRLMVTSENGTVRVFQLNVPAAECDSAHLELESTGQPLGKTAVMGVWDGVSDPSVVAAASLNVALSFAQFDRTPVGGEAGVWRSDTILFVAEPKAPEKIALSDSGGMRVENAEGLADTMGRRRGQDEHGETDNVGNEEKKGYEKEAVKKSFFPMGPSVPMPRRMPPQAIEHPVVTFKSWPITVEETAPVSAARADRWAIGTFKHPDQMPEDSDEDPNAHLDEARQARKKIFRSDILPHFANPERVRALANVARKHPTPGSGTRSPSSPVEPRPLGFHGRFCFCFCLVCCLISGGM
jgi:hypothetical protein